MGDLQDFKVKEKGTQDRCVFELVGRWDELQAKGVAFGPYRNRAMDREKVRLLALKCVSSSFFSLSSLLFFQNTM